MRFEVVAGVVISGVALAVCYNIYKSNTEYEVVYLPAPTIGSVKVPPLQQTAPITGLPNSSYLTGVRGVSYAE